MELTAGDSCHHCARGQIPLKCVALPDFHWRAALDFLLCWCRCSCFLCVWRDCELLINSARILMMKKIDDFFPANCFGLLASKNIIITFIFFGRCVSVATLLVAGCFFFGCHTTNASEAEGASSSCPARFLGGPLWSNAPFVFVRWIWGMKAEGSPLGE